MVSISWGTDGGGDRALAWSGNSVLSAARIVSAAEVSLAPVQAAVDANTRGLWRMDEASWNGTANEVVDSSGSGNHGTAYNSATTAAGWIDRCGSFTAASNHYVLVPSSDSLKYGLNDTFVMDCWFKYTGASGNGKYFVGYTGSEYLFGYLNTDSAIASIRYGSPTSQTYGQVMGTFQDSAWHHFAFQTWVVSGNRYARLAVDGAWGTERNATAKASVAAYNYCIGTYWQASPAGSWTGLVDDLRISMGSLYTPGTDFSPYRYSTGTVVATNNSLHGDLNEVSWASVESGDNEGDIAAVEVWSAGSWTAIGGASPSSPITGLEIPVTTGALLRFTLAPKSDALQSETPILNWVKGTITPKFPQGTSQPLGARRERLW